MSLSRSDLAILSPSAAMRAVRHGDSPLSGMGSRYPGGSSFGSRYRGPFGGIQDSAGPLQMITQANAGIAQLLQPLGPVIDLIPNPPYYTSFTSDFKVRPIDALLNLIKPIQNLVYESIENANRISGVATRRVGLPGTPQVDVVMGLQLPGGMSPTDAEFTKRLKAVNNLMILGYQDPVSLARGIVQTLVNEGQHGVEIARSIIQTIASKGVPLAGFGAGPTPPTKFLKAMADALRAGMPNVPEIASAIQAKLAAFNQAVAQAAGQIAAATTALAKAVADVTRLTSIAASADALIASTSAAKSTTKSALAVATSNKTSADRAVAQYQSQINDNNTKMAARQPILYPLAPANLVKAKADAAVAQTAFNVANTAAVNAQSAADAAQTAKVKVASDLAAANAAKSVAQQALNAAQSAKASADQALLNAQRATMGRLSGFGAAPVVAAAGATTAEAGGGVASAGVAAETTAPATTVGISALIASLIAYAVENPEQTDKIIDATGKVATSAAATASSTAAKAPAPPTNAGKAATQATQSSQSMGPANTAPLVKPTPWGAIIGGAAVAGALGFLATQKKRR